MSRRPFTEEDDAYICLCAELGMTRAEIAQRLERDESVVFRRIRRLLNMGRPVAAGKPGAPQKARQSSRQWRACLCCQRRFLSAGAHNRLCALCGTESTDRFSQEHSVGH